MHTKQFGRLNVCGYWLQENKNGVEKPKLAKRSWIGSLRPIQNLPDGCGLFYQSTDIGERLIDNSLTNRVIVTALKAVKHWPINSTVTIYILIQFYILIITQFKYWKINVWLFSYLTSSTTIKVNITNYLIILMKNLAQQPQVIWSLWPNE
jgi:hypothetical protein